MKTKFKESDFYFYYLRRDDGQPYGCVCLRRDITGMWARGISLCASMDPFSKQQARRIARGRCLRALFTHENTECMMRTDREAVGMADGYFQDNNLCKSQYGIKMTDKELAITKDDNRPAFNRDVEIAQAAGIVVGEVRNG